MHAVLTREGLVLDEEATGKVRRKALSASTAKSLVNNCAASFAFSKLAGEKRADPFAATDQGTAAHAVLEELYKLAPSKRTERRAINILLALQERWQKGTKKEPPLYPELGNPVTRAKFQSEVIEKYSGIFTIEDPSEVDVVRTEWPLTGIELRGVPFIGFVDRTDRVILRGKTGLQVVDYKTSKAVPDRAKIARYGDGHGDQIRLYVAALTKLEDNDEDVIGGKLYYTKHGKSVAAAVAKPRVNSTVGEFVRSWDIHNTMVEEQKFPTKVGPLCGWCPLVKLCPAAQASKFNVDRTPSQTALDETDICEIEETFSRPVEEPETAPEGSLPAHREPSPPPTEEPDEISQTTLHEGETMSNHPMTEGKPWDVVINDKLNGSSYAAPGYFGMASLAYEYMNEHNVPVQKVSLPLFAETLAGIVSEVQQSLSGSTDFQGGTNTRVRGVLRSVLDSYPAPFGKDAEAWETWRKGTLARVKAICQTALTLYKREGEYTFNAEALSEIAPKS